LRFTAGHTYKLTVAGTSSVDLPNGINGQLIENFDPNWNWTVLGENQYVAGITEQNDVFSFSGTAEFAVTQTAANSTPDANRIVLTTNKYDWQDETEIVFQTPTLTFTTFTIEDLGGTPPVDEPEDNPYKNGPAKQNKERLLQYLNDEYGNHIISGQMDTAWDTDGSIDTVARVYADTNKYPAIKGFDFINVRHPTWYSNGYTQTQEAIDWWKNGPITGTNGIVAFCWHWKMPATGTVRNDSTDTTDMGFTIPYKNGQLDQTDPKWALIKEDLDLVVAELKILQAEGIPVLWRPLHEASNADGWNGWFWWGAERASYKALWAYIYDYFTAIKGLDNLIWVWNGQNGAWYPDPNTVDIAGYDAYDDRRDDSSAQAQNYSAWKDLYTQTASWAPGKIVALSENGAIPDPDALESESAEWAYFMTWDDHGPTAGVTDKDNYWTGEWHNTNAHKTKVYNHDYVITLDELPVLSTYPLN
jgi:mannan endo-1,4-beta-mannosidase